MQVNIRFFHNDDLVGGRVMDYAGRPNVFRAPFVLPAIQKNYETLRVEVTAIQADRLNFGSHQRSFKLIP